MQRLDCFSRRGTICNFTLFHDSINETSRAAGLLAGRLPILHRREEKIAESREEVSKSWRGNFFFFTCSQINRLRDPISLRSFRHNGGALCRSKFLNAEKLCPLSRNFQFVSHCWEIVVSVRIDETFVAFRKHFPIDPRGKCAVVLVRNKVVESLRLGIYI